MTGDLVEQMAGHRTRLAQQSPKRRHDGEDEALERYMTLSCAMDHREAFIRSMPQGWYLVGLLSALPSLLVNTAPAGLAVAIGGVLLGGAALGRLSSGLMQLAAAACAWREVKPLYEAAAVPEAQPSPEVVLAHAEGQRPRDGVTQIASEPPILDATEICFSYPGRPQPVLRGGSMRINRGDHVLIEGPSGGGKSTFASVLAGLRQPQSGLLLLEGLDRQTVGPDAWRRRVAAAPQFHDNHVLSETFLFNLLMGGRWPPTPDDIGEALDVCRELGLGELLSRMPSGLNQMVGESGWRLSHGERSRLYIARALLQRAKIVLLDESFASLDPKTAEQCLRCVCRRAPALVVIAHP